MRNSHRRTVRISPVPRAHVESHVRHRSDRAMQLCTLVVVFIVVFVVFVVLVLVLLVTWRVSRVGVQQGWNSRVPGGIRKANTIVTRSRTTTDSVKYTLLSMPSARCSIHLRGKWNYKRIPARSWISRLRLTPSAPRVTGTHVKSTIAEALCLRDSPQASKSAREFDERSSRLAMKRSWSDPTRVPPTFWEFTGTDSRISTRVATVRGNTADSSFSVL